MIALYFSKFNDPLKWHFKQFIAWMGYGLYHFSVRLSMGAFKRWHRIPPILRHKVERFLGDFGFLILDFLKKSVWRMSGSGLQIVFVGSKQSSLDMLSLFFDGAATYEQIGEVSTFGLCRRTKKWLDGGCDLVVSELSRLHPFRPKTPTAFTVPQWVNQIVDYPEQLSTLLTRDLPRSLRRQIKRCQNAGCQWRFSRSRTDFDYFYDRLYRPFVRSRHGEHAHIAPYPFQWDLWIKGAGGGLILVTQGDKIIAGAVCLMVDGVCHGIEIGILDADETLLKQGVYVYLLWCVAEWGKAQGAQSYNLGGTQAWRSNGSYQFKAKWKPHVTARKYATRRLTFAADQVSPILNEKINAIGFICEMDNCFYNLQLVESGACFAESVPADIVKCTGREGLAGVCVINPESRETIFKN